MFAKQNPFNTADVIKKENDYVFDLYYNFIHEKLNFWQKAKQEWPNTFSDELIDLIDKMLSDKASERLTIYKILNHNWILNKERYSN